MEKTSFQSEDKNRLAELIINYLEPKGEFKVMGDGGIVIKRNNGIFGWVFPDREDFLSLMISIINKIIEKKGNINYVEILCSDALGVIMASNDRIDSVKKLYTAHLIEADPVMPKRRGSKEEREFDVEIRVEKEKPDNKVVAIGRSLAVSEQIASILNRNKYIILRD